MEVQLALLPACMAQRRDRYPLQALVYRIAPAAVGRGTVKSEVHIRVGAIGGKPKKEDVRSSGWALCSCGLRRDRLARRRAELPTRLLECLARCRLRSCLAELALAPEQPVLEHAAAHLTSQKGVVTLEHEDKGRPSAAWGPPTAAS